MRVAVIGVRRVRQGLGPCLARFVVDAGSTLCAVVGTSSASVEQAAEQLRADLGVTPAAVTDMAGVLASGAEALIIATPHEAHAHWLQEALAAGLPVLCEKPLVWGSADPSGDAERIASGFHAKRLHLHVNTQWPWTLATYRSLFPSAPAVPQRFSMSMPPRLTGLAALLDTLSHPLSMLATLAPDPNARISHIAVSRPEDSDLRLSVAFLYQGAGHDIEVELALDSAPDERRTTSYALDEYRATRVVDPDSYAMTLEGTAPGGAFDRIPLPDPTPRLVRSFLDAVAAGPSTGMDPAAVPGMRHLEQIMKTAAHQLGEPCP